MTMKRVQLLVILKQNSLLMNWVRHVYMAYQNSIKHLLILFQITEQLYLKMVLQQMQLENIY